MPARIERSARAGTVRLIGDRHSEPSYTVFLIYQISRVASVVLIRRSRAGLVVIRQNSKRQTWENVGWKFWCAICKQ